MKNKNIRKMITAKGFEGVTTLLKKYAGNDYQCFEYNKGNEDAYTIFMPKSDEMMPCIVSHADIVGKNEPIELKISDKGVMTNPDGILGADDRAGCYIIGEMMKAKVRARFIITENEECGGIGAGACAKEEPLEIIAPMTSCFIELDRRGSNDCATYGVDNSALIQIFGEHGYNEAWGSYTDIVDLCEATNIAGVNLSVGYYNEHTKNESLNLKELDDTLQFMLNLPEELYCKQYGVETNIKEVEYAEEICCDICGEHEKLWYVGGLAVCELCKGAETGMVDTWYDMEIGA